MVRALLQSKKRNRCSEDGKNEIGGPGPGLIFNSIRKAVNAEPEVEDQRPDHEDRNGCPAYDPCRPIDDEGSDSEFSESDEGKNHPGS